MANKDFCYCLGQGCSLKDKCVRYLDGKKITDSKEGRWWFMEECGIERNGYIEYGKVL